MCSAMFMFSPDYDCEWCQWFRTTFIRMCTHGEVGYDQTSTVKNVTTFVVGTQVSHGEWPHHSQGTRHTCDFPANDRKFSDSGVSNSLPFNRPTTTYPRLAFLSRLCSVFVRTALAGTFSTLSNSFTARIFPANSGEWGWYTVCIRRWIPSVFKVAFFRSPREIAERKSVIL